MFVLSLTLGLILTVAPLLVVPAADADGIAALYPGDVGIENHPDVILVEKFEEATLTDLFNRWTDILNGSAMSFSSDVPLGSPGSRSLNIPWVGGHNPPLPWPNPQAGLKPVGNDRFIAAAEQNNVTYRFDHYNYWMSMHISGDGRFWGNFLLNDPTVQATGGRWTCVEHMVKLNNPVTSSNGEHAIWLDGVKVSHVGQGFPNGYWSGGIFTQDPRGSPFEGFRWRSDSNLQLNWIWLQNYSPDDPAGFAQDMHFDHVVVAKSYIGCLTSGSIPRWRRRDWTLGRRRPVAS